MGGAEERWSARAKTEIVLRLLKGFTDTSDLTIWRSAVYRFHALLGQSWRDRRVFLMGDAVHQTPPFLGQGMCSGLRDAANLAWKLRDVITGPDGLLYVLLQNPTGAGTGRPYRFSSSRKSRSAGPV